MATPRQQQACMRYGTLTMPDCPARLHDVFCDPLPLPIKIIKATERGAEATRMRNTFLSNPSPSLSGGCKRIVKVCSQGTPNSLTIRKFRGSIRVDVYF